ncbi:MAG TPA: hypothetical protein VEZ38_19810 [Paenibacillus sp.]|nr:hypothetical protein [Paenibacillus sp.]
MLAGVLFIVMQTIHPADTLASVSTGRWAVVHLSGVAMCLFGLAGITGIYARQAKASGGLGLAGYLLFSLFFALTMCFQFAEALIFPLLTTEAPGLLEGFLALAGGASVGTELGALATVYSVVGGLYMLGGTLFGIATFRSGMFPRWAAGLLAAGGLASVLVVSLLPHPLDRLAAAPIGVGLAWLGYSLWTERRE